MKIPGFYVIVYRDKKKDADFVYWGWHLSKENAYKNCWKIMDKDKFKDYKFKGFFQHRFSIIMMLTVLIPFKDIDYGKLKGIK